MDVTDIEHAFCKSIAPYGRHSEIEGRTGRWAGNSPIKRAHLQLVVALVRMRKRFNEDNTTRDAKAASLKRARAPVEGAPPALSAATLSAPRVHERQAAASPTPAVAPASTAPAAPPAVDESTRCRLRIISVNDVYDLSHLASLRTVCVCVCVCR